MLFLLLFSWSSYFNLYKSFFFIYFYFILFFYSLFLFFLFYVFFTLSLLVFCFGCFIPQLTPPCFCFFGLCLVSFVFKWLIWFLVSFAHGVNLLYFLYLDCFGFVYMCIYIYVCIFHYLCYCLISYLPFVWVYFVSCFALFLFFGFLCACFNPLWCHNKPLEKS